MGYEESHPWISFTPDLSRAPVELWLLAGEVLSKFEHLAGVPLQPEEAQRLMAVYLAKGAHATTAIEGNSLTEDQVLQQAQGRLELPTSQKYLGIEVANILEATNDILARHLEGQRLTLDVTQLHAFNRQVLRGLELPPEVRPGEIRDYSVGVADYRAAPPRDLAGLLEKFMEWLNRPWLAPLRPSVHCDLDKLEALLKAIVGHVYVAWIHPWGDGNGRTARLLEFYILVRSGIPVPACHLLSNHYNQTRAEYYRQLSQASKSGGDVLPFCVYALRGMADQLRQQLQFVKNDQALLFWQNHVHQALGESPRGRRLTHLTLDLAGSGHPAARAGLLDISPRVARDYADKGEKTLNRDVDELIRRGLLHESADGLRARTEIVLAYLPPVAPARTRDGPEKSGS